MKSLFLPLLLAGGLLLGVWSVVSDGRADEASVRAKMQAAQSALRQKEVELAQAEAALATQKAALARAENFLSRWAETYERGSLLDEGVLGAFASRNGVITQKKQMGMPAAVQLPNGAQVSATRMTFATQGAFSRSLRLLGELEQTYELANVVEARFSQQGQDLSSSFTILYPTFTFKAARATP